MNGRNVNPENRDFIIREAEKIIEDYIRMSKAKAGLRRKRRLLKELYWSRVKELLFTAFLVLGIGLLFFLLLYLL